MAFAHGISATLTIGSTALEGYCESATMNLARELAEIRVFSGGTVKRVPGLEDLTFTANGAYDQTAYTALFTAYKSTTPVTLTFKPNGTTSYSTTGYIARLGTVASGADKSTWSVEFSGTATVTSS